MSAHDHAHDHPSAHDAPLSGPALGVIDTYETKVGPRNGARIVAPGWIPPIRSGSSPTPRLHPVLLLSLARAGPTPGVVQVRSLSLAVIDPRGVLRECGVDLPGDVEV